MKPTKANTSDMPSPTFTDATTYMVPRSSPMLSSSFTPFYPRSQQQMYHSQLDALGNHDAGWYASPQDFNDVQKSYVYEWPHVREFYNQHSYTSSGSDPYKVCWVANDGNVRCGGAWQSAGNLVAEEYVYADDEADDSAYPHSDSLSYYAESPGMGKEFYACSTSNIASVPTVYPDPGITSPTAEPKMKQAATNVTKNRRAQTDSRKPSKESCFSSTDEHGLLEAVEIKHSVQATSNSTNKLQLLKGSNLNTSTMPISAEVNQKDVDSTNSLSPQSNCSQLLSTSGQCPGMILPKHMNAQSYHSSIIESSPLEQRNLESLLNMPSLAMEVEGKPCVEGIYPEGKMGLLSENAWLYSNGPQLLVKCIHNLSKVLPSSQSGTALNTLDPTDCFAIENTISILSERLYQASMSEGNVCQDQNCRQVAEQELNISDGKFNQQKSSFLLEGMKHNVKAVSPNRVLENEALDGLSKLTSDTWVEGDKRAEQFSFVVKKEFKKLVEDLLMLQCNVTKLQEDVAYERAESNATVRTYKKLWGEAQEALKLSRLEIKELRAELASLKQDFTNPKPSEGSGGLGADFELTKYGTKTSCINPGVLCENSLDVETGSSQCFTALNFQSEASSKKPFPACSEVVTNCFAPESISNHRENSSPWAKGEGTILRHNNQSGKRFEVSAVEPSAKHVGGTNLQDQVTQRLSLLLARQCVDLNKTDADRNVESPSILSTSLMQRLSLLRAREALDSNKTDADKNVELPSGLSTTSSEASSKLPREGEALPLDKKGDHFILSETLYMGNANKIGGAKVDLSCQMKPALNANYCDYSLLQTQSNTRNAQGMDVEDVNVSTFQEDEMEIICLKPGVAEGSFACSKEEPEWEHVVVNVPVEQKTTR